MINLFVLLHYRNRYYGNEYYDKLMDMFFERDSYFLPEGKNMLVDEFGKDYGIYFLITYFASRSLVNSAITAKR